MNSYTAIASRDERWWLVRIPGLGSDPDDGLYTQARNLAEVEPMARDLIALCLEIPEDSFGVEVQVDLPAEVLRHLQSAAELRDAAAHAQGQLAEEYRAAAKLLKHSGLTVRDIGQALDISHHRAQQLIRN